MGGAAATGLGVFTAAASALALVVGVVAILIRRPARPWVWWLLMLSSATVALVRVTAAAMLEPSTVVSRIVASDARLVLFYAALAAGLLLVGGRTGRRNLADTLDAAIVALGAFLLMWLFLLGGVFPLQSTTPITAYVRPIAVAVLAGVLTRLLFIVERPTSSFWLLVAATGCAMAGAFVAVGKNVAYPVTTRMEDTGVWFAAYAVLATAALLQPSAASPLQIRQPGLSRLSVVRVAVFVALTLLGPVVWVVAVVPSPFNPASVWELGPPVMIAALISLLLVWRLSLITQLADNRADQLEALQAELAYRATHDPLTGLSNRSVLISRLDAVVGRRGVDGRRSALLLLDLDGFKQVNDSFGHPVGDELLIEVGRRLSDTAPPGSTIVRLGGDEFAVLLYDVDEPSAVAWAEVIRDKLNQPFVMSSGIMSVSASVGVCVTPRVEKSSSEVLRDADLALYSAKASGKNRVLSFDKKLEKAHSRKAR